MSSYTHDPMHTRRKEPPLIWLEEEVDASLRALFASPTARYGWIGEHAVWAYVVTL